ncbi:MAG TPA: hypothetical protein VMF11_10585 [Candidatus Baltobacteraceae bacterium]|nr:hypothetical protein [Candidatus Baltobacteraceae bacterium]
MTWTARIPIALILLCACVLPAHADTTTFGLTLNGTSGAHIEPDQTQTIPFLPLPMFEFDHVHKNLRLHLEAMPPIGPVPLAQTNAFLDNADPRVSYFEGELLYQFADRRYAFGLGETIINQRTLYPPSAISQASRVVGLRLIARSTLFESGATRLEASLAVNPALQGLQTTTGYPLLPLAEYGSLVDSALRWSVAERRFVVVYGVRYINYTAAYRVDDSLADRNHLFMPFVGVDWPLHRTAAAANRAPAVVSDPARAPALSPPARESSAFGVTLLGTNGSRSSTDAYSATALQFAALPLFSFAQTFERYELAAEVILPNENSNPYAAPEQQWSYVNVDGLVHVRNARYALGLGDTIINLEPAQLNSFVSEHTRSEGLHLTMRSVLFANLHGQLIAEIRLTPYAHVFNQEIFHDEPTRFPNVFTSIDHGARIEVLIHHLSSARPFGFDYGIRYVNQTTDYGPLELGNPQSGLYLTRSSSLMPFVSLKVAI